MKEARSSSFVVTLLSSLKGTIIGEMLKHNFCRRTGSILYKVLIARSKSLKGIFIEYVLWCPPAIHSNRSSEWVKSAYNVHTIVLCMETYLWPEMFWREYIRIQNEGMESSTTSITMKSIFYPFHQTPVLSSSTTWLSKSIS